MEPERDVTLWPTAENYHRFVELCDDEIPDTFLEFQSSADAQLERLRDEGIAIDKISFDPEKMAVWCKTNFGIVNSLSRSAYAAFLALSD